MEKLHAFMMRHLRSIMKIRWQDKVTNIKVLKRAGLRSMEDLFIRKNLRCTEHFLRMPTDRLPRQVLYSQLPDGQRPRGWTNELLYLVSVRVDCVCVKVFFSVAFGLNVSRKELTFPQPCCGVA